MPSASGVARSASKRRAAASTATSASARRRCEARKQVFVFQPHMLGEVGHQPAAAARTASAAEARRGRPARPAATAGVRSTPHVRCSRSRSSMSSPTSGLPPLLHHREQAHLFLEHVLLERARHRREGAPPRRHRPAQFARRRHQPRQVAPVPFMKAFDDARSARAGRCRPGGSFGIAAIRPQAGAPALIRFKDQAASTTSAAVWKASTAAGKPQ